MKFSLTFLLPGICFLGLMGDPKHESAPTVVRVIPVKKQMALAETELTVSTVASGLDVPWEIIWGPDNWIWFTEQGGTVSKINPVTGEKKLLLKILPEVYRNRTLGLLCMALHPDMKKSPYVFLNYAYLKGADIVSKWVRYTYTGTRLNNPVTLLEVPGSSGHNGSRIAFAPDGKLMLATGDADPKNDAANSGNAQNKNALGGKILRLNIDGSVPADNPIPGSPVWALGFRVPQGLVYGANGNLYTAEHGNVNDDEVNLVRRGGNYGYPQVLGKCDQPQERDFCAAHNVTEPLIAWTPTIAPAGIDYYPGAAIPEWENAILMVTLKTQSLRVLKLNPAGTAVVDEKVYFEKAFGRLRDICVSPAGDVYISTSNRDWNPAEGFPKENDDRIIRIAKIKKSDKLAKVPATPKAIAAKPAPKAGPVKPLAAGALTYTNYCASCHKTDGAGVAGTFPPLKGAGQVKGDKEALIRIVLQGLSGPIQVNGAHYDQDMPAFSFLSDQEIAGVLTYVRTQFGQQAGPITSAEVNKVRLSLKK
jgi:glucose/arabinose dehydrogenase